MVNNNNELLERIYNVLEEVSEDLTKSDESELGDEVFEVMFKIGNKLGYYVNFEE